MGSDHRTVLGPHYGLRSTGTDAHDHAQPDVHANPVTNLAITHNYASCCVCNADGNFTPEIGWESRSAGDVDMEC